MDDSGPQTRNKGVCRAVVAAAGEKPGLSGEEEGGCAARFVKPEAVVRKALRRRLRRTERHWSRMEPDDWLWRTRRLPVRSRVVACEERSVIGAGWSRAVCSWRTKRLFVRDRVVACEERLAVCTGSDSSAALWRLVVRLHAGAESCPEGVEGVHPFRRGGAWHIAASRFES